MVKWHSLGLENCRRAIRMLADVKKIHAISLANLLCTIPLQQGKVYTPSTSLRTAPSMSWWGAHKRDPGWSQPDSTRSRALSRNALRLEIPFKGVECKRLKRKTSCISWSTKNKKSNTPSSWRTLWILFHHLKLSEGPVINLATSSSLVMEALWIWTTGQPKPITNKVSQIYHLITDATPDEIIQEISHNFKILCIPKSSNCSVLPHSPWTSSLVPLRWPVLQSTGSCGSLQFHLKRQKALEEWEMSVYMEKQWETYERHYSRMFEGKEIECLRRNSRTEKLDVSETPELVISSYH